MNCLTLNRQHVDCLRLHKRTHQISKTISKIGFSLFGEVIFDNGLIYERK